MSGNTKRWFVVEDGPAGDVWIVERDDEDEGWDCGEIQGAHGTIVAEFTEANGGKAAADLHKRELLKYHDDHRVGR